MVDSKEDKIKDLRKKLHENEELLDDLKIDMEVDGDDEFWFWGIKVRIWNAEEARDKLQDELKKL